MKELKVGWGTGYLHSFKVLPHKIFMKDEGKKALQWKSLSDSTLIKQSKRISSLVGQIKTAISDKMNTAWLYHLYDIVE